MAQKSKANLTSTLNLAITDAKNKQNTSVNVRGIIQDIIDSTLGFEDVLTGQTLNEVLLNGNNTGEQNIISVDGETIASIVNGEIWLRSSDSANTVSNTFTTNGLAMGSPLSGLQYKVAGDQTVYFVVGGTITITGQTNVGNNNGTHVLDSVLYDLGNDATFFTSPTFNTYFFDPFTTTIVVDTTYTYNKGELYLSNDQADLYNSIGGFFVTELTPIKSEYIQIKSTGNKLNHTIKNEFNSPTNIFSGDVIIGDNKVFKTSNGGGQLNLDPYGDANSVMLSIDNGGYNDGQLYITNNSFAGGFIELSTYLSQSSINILTNDFGFQIGNNSLFYGNKLKIYGNSKGLTINDDLVDTAEEGLFFGYTTSSDLRSGLIIKNNLSIPRSTLNFDSPIAFLNSKNSTANSFVLNSVILGGDGLTATESNTVYVPNLNIKNFTATTIVAGLGIDANGYVVTGNTASSFTGGTVTGNTYFTANVTASTFSSLLISNTRLRKRFVSVASSATPAVNTDNGDVFSLTGLSANITNASTYLTGTPTHGDLFSYEITDNGVARTITWGTSFSNTGTLSLPTTTVISTLLRCLFQYNSLTSKWEIVAVV